MACSSGEDRGSRIGFLVVAAALLAACSSGPTNPTGTGGGGGGGGGGTPPPPPPPNDAPVIASMVVQGTRAHEPADFADVGESVPVTATVIDADATPGQLTYKWEATVGSFSGTGASVLWQAPAAGAVATPLDVTITLTVTEKYGYPGQPPAYEQSVWNTKTLSLHNSVKEVGDMARQFLLDFSDSSIKDVPYIMRNFDPVCDGTASETADVTSNRQNFNIVRSNIGQAAVTIPFGDSFCPIPGRTQRGDACSAIPSHWESIILKTGALQIVDGIDWVAAYYRPKLKAWKLCDSQYVGVCVTGCLDAPKFIR
jgi:hypothetical protein